VGWDIGVKESFALPKSLSQFFPSKIKRKLADFVMFIEQPKTKYDLNFPLFNIPICIHPFFWLIAVALGWSEDTNPGQLSVWVLCISLSILVHELGHAFAAKKFGARDISIQLNAMGGITKFHANLGVKQRIIELICGPFAGFIVFFLTFLISKVSATTSSPYLVHFALSQLMYINLFWGLLNLLPIYPMDGGQILNEIILTKRPWEARERTLKISMIVSGGVAIAFLIPAIYSLFSSQRGNWFPVILFFAFALMNYHSLKGNLGIGGNSTKSKPEFPWQKESDWWKK